MSNGETSLPQRFSLSLIAEEERSAATRRGGWCVSDAPAAAVKRGLVGFSGGCR